MCQQTQEQRALSIQHATSCLLILLLTFGVIQRAMSQTDRYIIDTKGAHAFIQFKINHLGFSWLLGQFNQFTGEFHFDDQHPANSSVQVEIDIKSIDTNHNGRDKHLRGTDFFDVEQFPTATFISKTIEQTGDTTGKIIGNLTLKGITKLITLEANHVGGGSDPWGGTRHGFEATTTIQLKDFGIDYDLGPASQTAQIYLSVEGILQKQ